MTVEDYKKELLNISTVEEEMNFIQKYFFNGTPDIFKERDGEYYDFLKRIADNFQIQYSDVNIVGSSRFGFSPYKFTEFSYESDIDVTLCNDPLFEKFFHLISDYTYKLRYREIFLRNDQYKSYVKFIKYFSTGWMRPDLLPSNTTEFKEIRERWDEFFNEISYGNTEVGNYKVKAGLFKNQEFAEKYYRSSIGQIRKTLSNL